MFQDDLYIIGDFGGTHARVAYAKNGSILLERVFLYQDSESPIHLIRSFMTEHAEKFPAQDAIFAFAGPVINDMIKMTNLNFYSSADELKKELGLRHVKLINDFAAQVAAIPYLDQNDISWVDGFQADPSVTPYVVLGPGTGLGVGYSAYGQVVASEGGGISFSPYDDFEIGLWHFLKKTFKEQLIAEIILSGKGLSRLYQYISKEEEIVLPEVICEMAHKGHAFAKEAYLRFFLILARYAGDMALAIGAKAVYLAGGILPRPEVISLLDAEDFRHAFSNKYARDYMLKDMPVGIVLRKHAALLGLSKMNI